MVADDHTPESCADASGVLQEHSSSSNRVTEDRAPLTGTCRFCLEDDTLDVPSRGPLISPCACRGTSRFVHRACLDMWRRETTNPRAVIDCITCHTRYPPMHGWPQLAHEFSENVDADMPNMWELWWMPVVIVSLILVVWSHVGVRLLELYFLLFFVSWVVCQLAIRDQMERKWLVEQFAFFKSHVARSHGFCLRHSTSWSTISSLSWCTTFLQMWGISHTSQMA